MNLPTRRRQRDAQSEEQNDLDDFNRFHIGLIVPTHFLCWCIPKAALVPTVDPNLKLLINACLQPSRNFLHLPNHARDCAEWSTLATKPDVRAKIDTKRVKSS